CSNDDPESAFPGLGLLGLKTASHAEHYVRRFITSHDPTPPPSRHAACWETYRTRRSSRSYSPHLPGAARRGPVSRRRTTRTQFGRGANERCPPAPRAISPFVAGRQ